MCICNLLVLLKQSLPSLLKDSLQCAKWCLRHCNSYCIYGNISPVSVMCILAYRLKYYYLLWHHTQLKLIQSQWVGTVLTDHRCLSKCQRGNLFRMFYVCFALCALLSAYWIIAEPEKNILHFFLTATSNSQSVLESSPSRSSRYSQTEQILTETNKRDVRWRGREEQREFEPRRDFFFWCCVLKRISHFFTPVSQMDQTHKYKAEPPKQTY